MRNDYEFDIGQRVNWIRENGDKVPAWVVDRTRDTVFLLRNDMPDEAVEVHRGLFSRLELA